ncbi:hypothetical protein [Fundidesulfovibrio agrisoli]|uniref:hypothetical protein n=1 Tax=Fundidesulfovibrio agrisoli TaxID=2922717 RepID=UPI001FAE3AB9|nr:hypothetical protein [Fundidesulfovibrio agrisoli]
MSIKDKQPTGLSHDVFSGIHPRLIPVLENVGGVLLNARARGFTGMILFGVHMASGTPKEQPVIFQQT